MSFKRAFRCAKCPGRNDVDGCPMWWEVLENNRASGEDRITKGCGYVLMPQYLAMTIAHANRPAEEISAMRGEIIKGLAKIAKAVGMGGLFAPPPSVDTKEIEAG